MSDMQPVLENNTSDSKRLLVALLGAIVIHLCLFAVFGIIRLTERPLETAPVSVELVPGTLAALPPAGGSGASAGGAASAPASPPAGARTAAGAGASGQEFVIPTPRQGTEQAAQPSGPAFRVEGGRTGSSTGNFRTASSPVEAPVFPHAPAPQPRAPVSQGGGGGAAPSRGVGVLVEGGAQPGVQGSLDLGSLDKSLAGSPGTPIAGAGNGAPSGSAGGAGGAGATGARAGSGGGGRGDIKWDQPEAAKARILLSSPSPKVPPWVSREGLTLTVLIDFVLTPDGILTNVNIEASSGYNDVDAAVAEAVRQWRFNPEPGARPVHGLIPYVIHPR